MVIARGEFINELEKNVEFRQRYAERERLKREKEEAARIFMEEYNRIVGEAARETEIAIDKKLTEVGLKCAADIDELIFQVIYEMPTRYGIVSDQLDKKDGGSRTSNFVKLMKDVMIQLVPKYEIQGWHLTYRHIKGGIFIFTIE
jgi:DNA primase catalytic subunit